MTLQPGSALTGLRGDRYILGPEKGKGGEGIVYAVKNKPSLAAKIYKAPNGMIERKLKCMVDHAVSPYIDGKLMLAWPQDVLYSNGRFAGYTMPLVKDVSPIYVLCRNNPDHVNDCHTLFPTYRWSYSVVVAYHLAWVVDHIHKNHYVLGDMNSNNIVIHKDGSVTILDVDSFDICDPVTGEHFPCTVGLPEFLAPELQVPDLRRAKFSEHSDDFALAIHIFQLLMNNYHPFNSRTLSEYKRSTPLNPQQMNIVQGNCPYVKQIPNVTRPVGAPSLQFLPARIQTAFRTTFNYDEINALSRISSRVSADMWRQLLYDLYERIRKGEMKVCGNNPEHMYFPSHGGCPFCLAQQAAPASGSGASASTAPPPSSSVTRSVRSGSVTRSSPAPVSGSGKKAGRLSFFKSLLS